MFQRETQGFVLQCLKERANLLALSQHLSGCSEGIGDVFMAIVYTDKRIWVNRTKKKLLMHKLLSAFHPLAFARTVLREITADSLG